ncbi:monovalent cation/H+ antiporter subunit E [Paenibacillus stellifer]|uniref:Monovalent cation/H+ antiporter subunit E n=1 Tax=Paenibacillus stellifer TaxID=169760 RepID=A0A089LPX6_9BACL|nr:Na+/H+ antiporter subunit E [Paenibacillus stellifer]AIQ63596.1 monovalent cation/H+ antiporter subunit E [Paenibacillus stellifer]
MAYQIGLNVLIAVLWMVLNDNWTGGGLTVGYVIGAALLFLFRKFGNQPFYLKRVWAVVKLLGIFSRELVKSGVAVIRNIVRPKLDISPGIFAYETKLTTDWEITILSCLICLTPGTLTLEVSGDKRMLYIHAMDIQDAGYLCEDIRNTFEQAIAEVTAA